jgi:enoyl-CoA hydratase/carnithine racemase
MQNQETQYQVSDRVVTITLNRPDKLNAWTAIMESEVRAAIGEAERDDNVRVIVLTDAGRGILRRRGHVALEHRGGKRSR